MTAFRTLVWCPSHEGHLRYSHHVADGVRQADAELATGVLTTCPVPEQYHSVKCPVVCVGQKIRPAASFPSRFHWLADRVSFHLRQELALFRWLRSHRDCELVHLQEIHFFTGPLITVAIRKLLRKQVVLTVHNIFPHKQRRFTPVKLHRQWTAQTMRQADALIVHDAVLKEQLVAACRVSTESVHVIPHGVWEDDQAGSVALRPSDEQPMVNRKDGPVVLFYGTIRANKGLHNLLDSFVDAPASWQLIIAGSPLGHEEYFNEEILPRVEKLRGNGRRIECFFDFVPQTQVRSYFERASVLALPYQEFAAQSGVLFDAICYRLPVVCTDVGAIGSAVKAMDIGVVAGATNPQALIAATSELLDRDPVQLAQSLEQAARDNSWQQVGVLTADLYHRLIG